MEPHLTACLSRSVRFLREGHGWTQSDLVDRSGIARRSLVKIENTPMRANARVRTSLIDRIAEAAGISSGMLTLTPPVLSQIGDAEIRPVGRRKEALRQYDRKRPFAQRSRDYVVIAQGGTPNSLFDQPKSQDDG